MACGPGNTVVARSGRKRAPRKPTLAPGDTMCSVERCACRVNNPKRVMGMVGMILFMVMSVSAQKALPTYELYSWKEGDTWNFNVLPDTNRQKTVEEVFDPKKVLRGFDQLKKKLSEMPTGTRIGWFDRLTIGGARLVGSERLGYPPEKLVDEVMQFARSRKIEILGPPEPSTP